MDDHTCGRRTISLFVLGLLLLAGCRPTTGATFPPSVSPLAPTLVPTGTPVPVTTVTVWHSWGAGEEMVVRELLVEYQSLHPGVTVRLRRVAVDGIIPEYEDAVLAGEGPDLLAGWSHWIGRLADGKVISPLDRLLESGFWGSYYPFSLEGVRYQEQLYAVPYSCETVVLYYNRAFVVEPPTTTTALLDLAATWPGQEQAGLAFPLSFYNTVGYLYAFGGRLLSEDGHAALDSPETRAWLFWLYQLKVSPGVVATDSYGQADALFKSGSAAMVVNGSWALSDYIALGDGRLGVARLPMLDQTRVWPTPMVGCRVLMVNPVRLPAHPQATLELLRFLAGPLPQRLLAARYGALPTWKDIDLSSNALLEALLRQAEAGRPRPVSVRMDAVWDPVENLIYNVTSRRVPVDVALQETQKQIEQALLEMEGISP